MKPVILESPYAARDPQLHPEDLRNFYSTCKADESWATVDRDANVAYARKCLLDCLHRGEAPIASHLLYTQILDDTVPEQRQLGIDAGLAWRARAQYAVFYVDRGWSRGMVAAYDLYRQEGVPYEIRRLTPGDEHTKGPR
jgi:hypothetical protein